MPVGAFRRVLLLGPWAIKVPRLSNFTRGLRCNRWEREMWRTWRPVFGWENLCPVLHADPVGLFLIMPRAQQPVSETEALETFSIDYWPGIDVESKRENFGRVGERVLVLDYGLPGSDDVAHRRAYLKGHPSRGAM